MNAQINVAPAANDHAAPVRKAISIADRTAFSVNEFCALNGVGRATVYRWAQAGIISLSKSGGRTLITREAVDAWKARMAA